MQPANTLPLLAGATKCKAHLLVVTAAVVPSWAPVTEPSWLLAPVAQPGLQNFAMTFAATASSLESL